MTIRPYEEQFRLAELAAPWEPEELSEAPIVEQPAASEPEPEQDEDEGLYYRAPLPPVGDPDRYKWDELPPTFPDPRLPPLHKDPSGLEVALDPDGEHWWACVSFGPPSHWMKFKGGWAEATAWFERELTDILAAKARGEPWRGPSRLGFI